MSTRVLAVDLGATSVRVAAADLGPSPPALEVVHRWHHGPVEHADGTLRWDWEGITREVRRGLDLALDQGPAASIGVDGWGVDYGLLDAEGALVSTPFSYRDRRTDGWELLADGLGRDRLYATTGIQLMPINTIFQLAVHDDAELARASHLLLLPDLLVHDLTGHVGAERSNASTTALLDPSTGRWAW
ncbi:MAG TPA: FGGY family carbohydrate kinase, partial [Nitriliruptorales bacterium]